MRTSALVINGLAILGALYVAKMLVVDVAWADHRIHGGGWGAIFICLILGAAIVALPAALGLQLGLRGQTGASLGVGLGALALDGLAFAIVALAFTP